MSESGNGREYAVGGSGEDASDGQTSFLITVEIDCTQQSSNGTAAGDAHARAPSFAPSPISPGSTSRFVRFSVTLIL